MDKRIVLTKREFLISLGSTSIGAMSGVSLLSSCTGLSQLSELGELGIGTGLVPTLLVRPQTITSKLTPHFPLQKSYQGLAGVSFADPVVSMVPNVEKVRVGLTTAAGITGGQQVSGRCQLACGLRYDPETRAIYLKDTTVEDFQLTGVNSQLTSGFKNIANGIGSEILEAYPIYSLADRTGAGLLKSMNVTDEGVKLSFGLL